MFRALAAALCLTTALVGCTTFPEVDAAHADATPSATWPQIVPLEGVLAQAEGARIADTTTTALDARAARLRARAAAMRSGRGQSPATRARLVNAIKEHQQP